MKLPHQRTPPFCSVLLFTLPFYWGTYPVHKKEYSPVTCKIMICLYCTYYIHKLFIFSSIWRHIYALRDLSSYNEYFAMSLVLNSLQSFTESAAITVLQVKLWPYIRFQRMKRLLRKLKGKYELKLFVLFFDIENFFLKHRLNLIQSKICSYCIKYLAI